MPIEPRGALSVCYGMAATHVVQLATYDTPETAAAVKALVKRDRTTVARWVRTAIREKLRKETANGKTPQSGRGG